MNLSDGTSVPPEAEYLANLIAEEVKHLLELLPEASARQWLAAPVPKPRYDTDERSIGGAPGDPTADVALDPRRLAVRRLVRDSEKVLRDTAVRVRGVRRAMERTLDWYDGEEAR